MMRRIEEFTGQLLDMTTMTKREYYLTLTVCALGGIILGFLFSPIKKGKTVRIRCGNNNGNTYPEHEECEEDAQESDIRRKA